MWEYVREFPLWGELRDLRSFFRFAHNFILHTIQTFLPSCHQYYDSQTSLIITMIRSIAKHPLLRQFVAARPAVASCVRAGLGAQALDLSTNLQAKRQENQEAKQAGDASNKEVPASSVSQQKQNPLQNQQQQYQDPWEEAFNTLWRRHAGFDDVFTRDPFFAPFFQQDPFERLRKRMMMDHHDMIMPVLRSELPSSFSKLVQSSPGYEIKETENAYEIAMDVPPEIRAEDLNVEVVQNGPSGQVALRITGERRSTTSSDASDKEIDDKNKSSTATSMMRFTKQFTIGNQVDAEHLQANFADGCLVVRAPKLEPVVASKENTRQIPISTRPHAEMLLTDEELKYKNFNDAFDESDWAETGKRTTAQNTA